MTMERRAALEWAALVRGYYETESVLEALGKADEIVRLLAEELDRKAEEEGWYSELSEAMGWDD